MTSVRSWMRTPRSRSCRAEAEREPSRLHGRVEAIQRTAEEERRGAASPHLVGRDRHDFLRRAERGGGVARSRPRIRPATPSSRRGASAPRRNQASTSFASHHAPIPRTASSDARQTASAAASPAFSRSVGASPQSVSQKPPFRPLGPCPQTAASSTSTSSSGSSSRSCHAVQRPRYPPPTIDDVGRRVALERAVGRDLAGLLEPPAVTGVTHQAGAAVRRRASAMLHAITAATATGTSNVQKSGRPPSAAPTETSPADSQPGGSRELSREHQRGAGAQEHEPEDDVARRVEVEERRARPPRRARRAR